jgi:hypothetical protein
LNRFKKSKEGSEDFKEMEENLTSGSKSSTQIKWRWEILHPHIIYFVDVKYMYNIPPCSTKQNHFYKSSTAIDEGRFLGKCDFLQ